MRLCDDCIYKNNCNEYQNKVVKTTPIDFDFFGCSGYKAESNDVFTRKEELSKEESEWLIDFITKEDNKDMKKGEWVIHNDYHENCRYGCNQCGNLTNIPGNFCPNCGVKMKKRGKEE